MLAWLMKCSTPVPPSPIERNPAASATAGSDHWGRPCSVTAMMFSTGSGFASIFQLLLQFRHESTLYSGISFLNALPHSTEPQRKRVFFGLAFFCLSKIALT